MSAPLTRADYVRGISATLWRARKEIEAAREIHARMGAPAIEGLPELLETAQRAIVVAEAQARA